MSESVDINVYSQVTIPNAMAELMDNHNKMEQISAYCKSLYANGDAAQAYEQTQGYAKNALLNVAYHIQTVGTHITSLLQLQTNEMEKLNIEIQTLTQRVRMIHDSTGTNVFSNQDAAKPYKSSLKNRKVDIEAAKPLVKYQHKPISYGMSAADINTSGVPPLNHSNSSANLNTSTGHLGNSTSNSSTPSYQSPNLSNSSPNPTGVQPGVSTPPTQNKAPIPPRNAPPPSLSVPAPPPSMSVPPPPPTSQRPPSTGGSNYDFPPPPPGGNNAGGRGSFDLPPPPSFGLPPPPSLGDHDFPPPPPPVGSYDFPPPPARPQSQFYSHTDLPPPPPPPM